MKIRKLFSWKDVERVFLLNEEKWSPFANRIVVYGDLVEISLKRFQDKGDMEQLLFELFDGSYDQKEGRIVLDINDEFLDMDFSGEEEPVSRVAVPLFRKMLYQHSAYDERMFGKALKGRPVIAFHSYKGGVGRTLSLLAFAKAWVARQPKDKRKLLIVDSDIEAPGLTWLQHEESEQHFSYLDVLEMIQNRKNDSYLKEAAKEIEKSTLQISTAKETSAQFFIPAYRYQEQLLDVYSKPEAIVTNVRREYIIPEVLSELGKELGVNAVLVDLRAGLSEYSAPFLFDPRVKTYFVTSTSSQSVQGISLVLEQVTKGLAVKEDTLLPEVLMTMIPDTMDYEEKGDILSEVESYFYREEDDGNTLTDHVVSELPFSNELIHLSSLSQIMRLLNNNPFYRKIEELVANTYVMPDKQIKQDILEMRSKVIENIHRFTAKQVTAEGNYPLDMMITQAISNLKKKYKNEIPCTVLLGAKGSGKTFLYRELLKQRTWQDFCGVSEQKEGKENDTFFIPILAPGNSMEISVPLRQCICNVNLHLNGYALPELIWHENREKLIQFIEQKHETKQWKEFWEAFMVQSVDARLRSFSELNEMLAAQEKKIVFLMDGLEEVFQETAADESQQRAVSVLCQDIVNTLGLRYPKIGCIFFMRKDLARDSIRVNFEQFNQLYYSTELKWTQEEALKLALWLAAQAQKDFYREEVPIENASPELVEQYLQKLWGIKLGKASSSEAYSSRWILAALSDFNGQLQARDMVRFLQYATAKAGNPSYGDRYIMPAEIKNAVPECSRKKIEEIKQEIVSLRPIFEKLERLKEEKKVLPLPASDVELTAKEESLMVREGYLKAEGENYFIPEILRHSLGFRYKKGARPKVLSLLGKP